MYKYIKKYTLLIASLFIILGFGVYQASAEVRSIGADGKSIAFSETKSCWQQGYRLTEGCSAPQVKGDVCPSDSKYYKACVCPASYSQTCGGNTIAVGAACGGKYERCDPKPPVVVPPKPTNPNNPVLPATTFCKTTEFTVKDPDGKTYLKFNEFKVHDWSFYVDRGTCVAKCTSVGGRLAELQDIPALAPLISKCGWDTCDVYWTQGDPTSRNWVYGMYSCGHWAGYSDNMNGCLCLL